MNLTQKLNEFFYEMLINDDDVRAVLTDSDEWHNLCDVIRGYFCITSSDKELRTAANEWLESGD